MGEGISDFSGCKSLFFTCISCVGDLPLASGGCARWNHFTEYVRSSWGCMKPAGSGSEDYFFWLNFHHDPKQVREMDVRGGSCSWGVEVLRGPGMLCFYINTGSESEPENTSIPAYSFPWAIPNVFPVNCFPCLTISCIPSQADGTPTESRILWQQLLTFLDLIFQTFDYLENVTKMFILHFLDFCMTLLFFYTSKKNSCTTQIIY